ncbi:MAG: amidohydrolase [Massilibacillus sp.]|nr:amidohydrolase [Massilibacillus sp.]
MKIIDAHLHFSANEHFKQTAYKAGHLDSLEHLAGVFHEQNIVLGIGMGVDGKENNSKVSKPLTVNFGTEQPPNFLVQCLGIDTATITKENSEASVAAFKKKLEEQNVVGLKVYAGYQHFHVNDPVYHPFYELAEANNIPVVIHTGDTANSAGLLKFSHPLTVDEVAVNFPRVRFVMAHYGNPWIIDATEVAKKNPNVYIDLSGLAEGKFQVDWFYDTYKGYIEQMKTWLTYLSRYDKIMYGSDWPLVNMATYIEVVQRLIPEQYHQAVFYDNATHVFPRINMLLK